MLTAPLHACPLLASRVHKTGPASRRYGPATSPRVELMRNEVPCAQIRAFNTDSCKDVCSCVAEKAHASNGREALCVSVCNKCARAGRGCTEGGTQKLSGICLKVIQNQMVQECVASYTGDRE